MSPLSSENGGCLLKFYETGGKPSEVITNFQTRVINSHFDNKYLYFYVRFPLTVNFFVKL